MERHHEGCRGLLSRQPTGGAPGGIAPFGVPSIPPCTVVATGAICGAIMGRGAIVEGAWGAGKPCMAPGGGTPGAITGGGMAPGKGCVVGMGCICIGTGCEGMQGNAREQCEGKSEQSATGIRDAGVTVGLWGQQKEPSDSNVQLLREAHVPCGSHLRRVHHVAWVHDLAGWRVRLRWVRRVSLYVRRLWVWQPVGTHNHRNILRAHRRVVAHGLRRH